MPFRYLYGPVSAAYADQNLHGPRQRGECLAFGDKGLDLKIGNQMTWAEIIERCPARWQPDFVVLNLSYTTIPPSLWSAPVPRVGLAGDWPLLWHRYRHCLGKCERVLTDTVGVETMARAGFAHARAANLFGCERRLLEEPWPVAERDIDVLFVGNVHEGVQRERLRWLGRVAQLAGRWRVEIHSGVFGDAYRALLARARVVFNRALHGEANKRVMETAAAGALLFQEAENREVPAYFRDRQECVYYTEENLEALLTHYLEHEDERRTIAEAGRARVQEYSFEKLWQEQLAQVQADWPELVERCQQRGSSVKEDVFARTWQALGCTDWQDETLLADLAAEVVERRSAMCHNALGLATARHGRAHGLAPAGQAQQVLGYFRRAVARDPEHVVAGLNLAEALLVCGQKEQAVEQARRTLATLDRWPEAAGDRLAARPTEAWLDGGHFPLGFDVFGVEWERAGWENAGRPGAEARAKQQLLRWRLHGLVAQVTDDLHHAYEAAVARPDLAGTHGDLGAALLHAGRRADALSHWRRALAGNPLDVHSAALVYHGLGNAPDVTAQRRLARERRRLHQAAPGVIAAEGWFMQAPPVGDELASIIILCCNEAVYTRRCLESVLRQTRAPYELVLIDNGSTDETAAYLSEIQGRPGPERVVVLRNEQNVGFPAGCNQGLAASRGDHVVFLNNDTVVTQGWLDGLIGWAVHDWPHVGLVGAVTNYSRPPQQIGVDYAGLENLDGFAARRRREFAGKALAMDRLAGFCLLARRDVLQRIGGFDDRYGVGFFDDDDLSVRALQAGYRLLLALNVFIHHFGNRTFKGLGIDCKKQLAENFTRFKEKWGPEAGAGYRVVDSGQWAVGSEKSAGGSEKWAVDSEQASSSTEPGKGALPSPSLPTAHSPLPTVSHPLPTVSLCLIVKNEEDNLAACLGSAADLVDEVIVVDTGSTDQTKEIAVQQGAKVVDFAWCDSFAAARNASLEHATGDWIFWMDADDRLDEENRGKLRQLFASLGNENVAYVMKCVCLPDQRTRTTTVVDHVRLFRNHPQIRWEYRVHEQILPAVRRLNGEVRWADVSIQHTGYQDPALRGKKLERDLRLLHLQDQERPDEPFTLFNLGSVYHELGKHAEALPLLRRSLERSAPSDSIVRKLFALIVQCHRRLEQGDLALAACRTGRGFYPDDAELLFLEGLVLREQGNPEGAEQAWLQLIHGSESEHFASVDAALRGPKVRHNLAILYVEQGRHAEAEALWRQVLAVQSEFLPAWLGLGDALLAQRRWPGLEQHCAAMQAGGHGVNEALVLRARGYLARQEFWEARRILVEEAIPQAPTALWPRQVLTHVLLQEGRDWTAAEQALRALLELAPNHAEARNNLAVLLRQRGQPA